MTDTLKDAIAECTGPNRELDAKVAEFFGIHPTKWMDHKNRVGDILPQFTGPGPDAALSLLGEEWFILFHEFYPDTEEHLVMLYDGKSRYVKDIAQTPQGAIILAAMEAGEG